MEMKTKYATSSSLSQAIDTGSSGRSPRIINIPKTCVYNNNNDNNNNNSNNNNNNSFTGSAFINESGRNGLYGPSYMTITYFKVWGIFLIPVIFINFIPPQKKKKKKKKNTQKNPVSDEMIAEGSKL